jgi:hypothetical protein
MARDLPALNIVAAVLSSLQIDLEFTAKHDEAAPVLASAASGLMFRG